MPGKCPENASEKSKNVKDEKMTVMEFPHANWFHIKKFPLRLIF